jgi:hypothetical protein
MNFYMDTSVFGGILDREFQQPTEELFTFIKSNNIKILHSALLAKELARAPEEIRLLANQFLIDEMRVHVTEEMAHLSQLYLKEGVLTDKSASDALHIAIATLSGANIVVSWNFKHMANFIKIRQYNAINIREGYGLITIHTPREIIGR